MAQTSNEAVKTATGKNWKQWFSVLDKAGAKKMAHRDIALLIWEKHLPKNAWWAQVITVEYERARGRRQVNQRSEGTYGMSVHRTVALPVATLYRKWLALVNNDPGVKKKKLVATTVHAARNIRYKAEDERLVVAFVGKNAKKSRIGITHEKLPTKAAMEKARAFWKTALNNKLN